MRPLLWSFEGARASDSAAARLTTWAVIATGKHLFPFRTEKLSPLAPMVLGEQSPGSVGRPPLTSGPRVGSFFKPFPASRARPDRARAAGAPACRPAGASRIAPRAPR